MAADKPLEELFRDSFIKLNTNAQLAFRSAALRQTDRRMRCGSRQTGVGVVPFERTHYVLVKGDER